MPRTLLVTTRKTEKKGSHVPIVLAFLAGGILTKVLDVPIALNNVVIISSPSASQAEPTTPQLDRDAPKELLDTRGLSYNNINASSTQEQAQTTTPHSVRPKIVYGHVHMAKTAGSTINGYLANHFDFVCGNKGNTHDYYNQNEMQKSKCGGAKKNCRTIDSFHKQRRLNVVNRKYVECDYISVEMGWQFWTQLDNPSQLPMELHVPCRDPVRHLMSMCNHYGRVYNCSEPDIATAVQHCMGYQNRFSMQLLNQQPQGIHVMCFESNPPHAYLQYMSDGKLVPRRHVSSPFVVREDTHAKNSNCIYDFPTLMGQVHDHMVTHYDYFRYCKDCIGSEQDLLKRLKRQ